MFLCFIPQKNLNKIEPLNCNYIYALNQQRYFFSFFFFEPVPVHARRGIGKRKLAPEQLQCYSLSRGRLFQFRNFKQKLSLETEGGKLWPLSRQTAAVISQN